MRVCGFSFIRNAIKYDYPIVEALQSILPLCDEVLVAVGKSEDDTRSLVQNISPKITIIDTTWDDAIRQGGQVLAIETQKAYEAISQQYDWCIYIQGDEVLHQEDYPEIKRQMKLHKSNVKVEGLLFKYLHFYGSYDYLATSGKWYNNEIRVIRHDPDIYSFGDAMGFRKRPNQKLKVKAIDATVYHYGWVKHPNHQQAKQKTFHKLWTDDKGLTAKVDLSQDVFDYTKIDKLVKYAGTHPDVMKDKIMRQNWSFGFDPSIDNRTTIEKLRTLIHQKTGWRPGEYRNYIKIK